MSLYNSQLYLNELNRVGSYMLPWDKLKRQSILITGATGMIGSFLVDVIMQKNVTEKLNCAVYVVGRSEQKANQRFSAWGNCPDYHFVQCDINEQMPAIENVTFALHLASNTHPVAYATDPIGTITANIIGTKNMLDFVKKSGVKRFVFASSNEIYGENRGDTEEFDESYCGYIDCNTLRAGYPESKRCGEALCQAYIRQEGLDIVIARLTRSYGPTMLASDTKAISQFIMKCVNGEDIVLKSSGTQYYSFTYVADAVAGLLYLLFYGINGEAYNIADEASNIRLKDLANLIATIGGKEVCFDIPNSVESAGFSKATKALLSASKIKKLGWIAQDDIRTGLEKTITILKETL